MGILRIALFDSRPFPELCEQAAARLDMDPRGCRGDCSGPLERETLNLLSRRFEEQIDALKRAGVGELLIDVTDNGGGNNWVGVAARMLTARRLEEPRQLFIRHEHWARQFRDRLATIASDRPAVRPEQRQVLDHAEQAYREALAATRKVCDRDVVWGGGTVNCSLLSDAGPLYGGGVLRYAPPGSRPEGSSCCYLFNPHRFDYREGVWTGRLTVVVDRETASAAEYFAAVLADNRAATIVGEATYGAGCGYTNGGVRTQLRHSGGIVRMPDCVRLRADGRNEVDGISPDHLVPWRTRDNPHQRARRLLEVLERLHVRPPP